MQHKAKLRTYRQLKTELRFEEYLKTRDREARSDDETERRDERTEDWDRTIPSHKQRQTTCREWEKMFDLYERRDRRWDTLYVGLWGIWRLETGDLDVVSRTLSRQLQPIEIEKERKTEEERKKIMAALMGELFTSEPDLRAAALHFCKRAMKRRNTIVREGLDQKTWEYVDNSWS